MKKIILITLTILFSIITANICYAEKTYLELKDKLEGKTVVVSTASPFKFVETVNEVFNINDNGISLIKKISEITKMEVPSILDDIYNFEYEKVIWKKEDMENNLRKLIGEIDENC